MKPIISILALLLLLFGCNDQSSIPIESDHFEMIQLADGVYGCIHKLGGKAICNAGVIDNGEATLVFDTFLSPDAASELLDAIKSLNLSPVKYVINSHSHNDHIRGNQVFGPEVKIISTLKNKELIEEWEPQDIQYEKEHAPERFKYYDSLYQSYKGDKNSREFQKILMWRPYYETLAESHIKIKTRAPDSFIDKSKNYDGPDREVQLISIGKGHTDSDLVLYLPNDEILFSGDLIFNQSHPYVPHGSIPDWINWLDYFTTLKIHTIIPGHGQAGDTVLIDEMKNYLISLNQRAMELIEDDANIQVIDSINVPDKYASWWFERFYMPNLKFAYEEAMKSKVSIR